MICSWISCIIFKNQLKVAHLSETHIEVITDWNKKIKNRQKKEEKKYLEDGDGPSVKMHCTKKIVTWLKKPMNVAVVTSQLAQLARYYGSHFDNIFIHI